MIISNTCIAVSALKEYEKLDVNLVNLAYDWKLNFIVILDMNGYIFQTSTLISLFIEH